MGEPEERGPLQSLESVAHCLASPRHVAWRHTSTVMPPRKKSRLLVFCCDLECSTAGACIS